LVLARKLIQSKDKRLQAHSLLLSLSSLSVLGLTSSESYPTALRGSAYGLSAAVGKTGAVVGTEVFKPVVDHLGTRFVFIIAAAIGLLGVLLTAFFIPDTTKFDLAAEDEEWRQYLLANGWDGYMGDGTVRSHKASDVVNSLGPHKRLQDDEYNNGLDDSDKK
jgi:MFS family permease